MHVIGAGWLMTTMTLSPLTISLVQTATALPVFLFALLAGTIADLFSGRRVLIVTNAVAGLMALIFALLVWQHRVDESNLLVFIFLMGIAAAFITPVSQSIVPELVKEEHLPSAVTLSGLSLNISRALGPVFAGLLMSNIDLSAPFLFNGVSFVGILLVLFYWKSEKDTLHTSREPVTSAFRGGLRFAVNSKPLKDSMWHIFWYMLGANSLWGLLPIIVKAKLEGNANLYGVLTGVIGMGAIIGSFVIVKLRKDMTANQIMILSTMFTSLALFVIGVSSSLGMIMCFCLLFGLSWSLVLSTLNISAQLSLPHWVRARGLAIFIMTFYGGTSLGTFLWGFYANERSVNEALVISSFLLVITSIVGRRRELLHSASLNFESTRHWVYPILNLTGQEHKPVLVQLVYEVDLRYIDAFIEDLLKLKASRLRHGALSWSYSFDSENGAIVIEQFHDANWDAHMRHHERVSTEDQRLQERLHSYLMKDSKPEVKHYLIQEIV